MPASRLCRFACSLAAVLPVLAGTATSSADFSYAFFFGMPADLTLQGDAVFQDEIRLTTGGDQRGAMWHQNKQTVATGFSTVFRFKMTPGPINLWGDGFAFVLQDSAAGTDALGDGGSGIGYSGIERSLSIELDTFSFEGEFATPHISIQSRGTDPNDPSDSVSLGHVNLADLGIDVLNESDHTEAIQYTPPNFDTGAPGVLQVYIDYRLVLEVNVDLQNLLVEGDNITDENGSMYVGITAATGLADTTHIFGSWAFDDDVQGCVAPFWYVGGAGWGGPGSTFGMGVEFLGTLPMSFHWTKDGTEILDDDAGRITGLGTNQLRVNDIQLPDAGHYVLIARNSCGEASSFDLGLRVCNANINCDALVDFFDYLDFVDAFSSMDPLADFNNDQSIDFFDYLDFVDAFSSGC